MNAPKAMAEAYFYSTLSINVANTLTEANICR